MWSLNCSSPHTTARSSSTFIAYFFSVSDKNLLAYPTGFKSPSFCRCHSVAPNPLFWHPLLRCSHYLQNSVLGRGHSLCIPLTCWMRWCVLLSTPICFVSSAVFSEYRCLRKNSRNFLRGIGLLPRRILVLFSFSGLFIFVIDSRLSCNGRIPCWSFLYPTHSISHLKNSHFFRFKSVSSVFEFFHCLWLVFRVSLQLLSLLLFYRRTMPDVCTPVFYQSVLGKLLGYLPDQKNISRNGSSQWILHP